MKHYFHGGIHPSDGTDKLLSNQKPIQIFTPREVEISMKQSPGSVCEAIVKKDDRVSKGDLIGMSKSFSGANIHASISGTVIDIQKRPDTFGRDVEIVFIRSDNDYDNSIIDSKYLARDYEERLIDLSEYTRDMIIDKMKDGGLTGLGGAGFPTHIKYQTEEPVNYILINAAECEPYLTCDHMLMLEHGYAIINGVLLLIKASGAKKAVICLEDNKQDAAKTLESIVADKELPMEFRILPTRYPQGGERQLVEAVLNMEVPAGKLPASIGVIINNVGTAKALADIVLGNEPLISRVITVTGKVKEPSNFLVPIGTRYSELIELTGGYKTARSRVISGGPMTGSSLQISGNHGDLNGSVLKISSGLLVLEDIPKVESPCIRCGECERVCPAGLAPFKIDFAAIEGDIKLCDKLYATECISCGCCSYVCPAKRELAYRITEAKTEIYRLRWESEVFDEAKKRK